MIQHYSFPAWGQTKEYFLQSLQEDIYSFTLYILFLSLDYTQALVSPFLLDDSTEDMEESCSNDLHGGDQPDSKIDCYRDNCIYNYDRLKVLDPVAANRIHPNNHRKINQYLSLYSTTGVLPSKLFQGKAIEGRTGGVLIISDMTVVLYVWMLLFQYWTNMLSEEWMK